MCFFARSIVQTMFCSRDNIVFILSGHGQIIEWRRLRGQQDCPQGYQQRIIRENPSVTRRAHSLSLATTTGAARYHGRTISGWSLVAVDKALDGPSPRHEAVEYSCRDGNASPTRLLSWYLFHISIVAQNVQIAQAVRSAV